jgi:hypothetical protein
MKNFTIFLRAIFQNGKWLFEGCVSCKEHNMNWALCIDEILLRTWLKKDSQFNGTISVWLCVPLVSMKMSHAYECNINFFDK